MGTQYSADEMIRIVPDGPKREEKGGWSACLSFEPGRDYSSNSAAIAV